MEVVVSAGSFLQTNAQLNLSNHTEKFAYYASLNGNRSDYGLAPPVAQVLHDAANGYGGFASLIYNRTPKDQLRLVTQLRQDYFQIPYDPNPASFENQQYDSSGLRDEPAWKMDGVAAFFMAAHLHLLHRHSGFAVLPLQPGRLSIQLHGYSGRDHLGSHLPVCWCAGLTLCGGRPQYRPAWLLFCSVSMTAICSAPSSTTAVAVLNFLTPDYASGGVVEEYVSDSFKGQRQRLTFTGGLRQSHFQGQFSEDMTAPLRWCCGPDPKAQLGLSRFLRPLLPAASFAHRQWPYRSVRAVQQHRFHSPFTGSGMRSTSSVSRFRSADGSSMPIPSRRASTTSSTTPTSAIPASTFRLR